MCRHLKKETGMTFRIWRQQIRLLMSLERLAKGEPVTNVAMDVGYSTPSAFITAFRQAFGTTPKIYFREALVQIASRRPLD
jgi:AraC-like DNA-binding protein